MLADVRHVVTDGRPTPRRRLWHDTLADDHQFRNGTLVPWPPEQENDVRPSAEVRLLAGQAFWRGELVGRRAGSGLARRTGPGRRWVTGAR
jgi:hypothetical protein